jgi:hypothetical protein
LYNKRLIKNVNQRQAISEKHFEENREYVIDYETELVSLIDDSSVNSALEITDWVMYGDDVKRGVLVDCKARFKELNKHLLL